MDSICIVRTTKEASETFLPNGTVSFKESSKSTIGILGSGDFAKSLAIRFIRSGYSVVIGSRNPKRAVGYFPPLAEIMHHEDAVIKTDLIFVAVHREHYASLWDLKPLLVGKILVDVSNNMRINQYPEANAEYLASLFPDSTVVKGFNVISAWALQFGPRNANRQVRMGNICRFRWNSNCRSVDRLIAGQIYKWIVMVKATFKNLAFKFHSHKFGYIKCRDRGLCFNLDLI